MTMTNSSDAPHTRESELRDLKAKFMAWNVIPDLEGYLKATHGMIPFDWAMDAMRRISTPIPLTPSDEMVEAACRGYIDSKYPTFKRHGPANIQSELGHMKAALQAALNLMGGEK